MIHLDKSANFAIRGESIAARTENVAAKVAAPTRFDNGGRGGGREGEAEREKELT